MNAAERTRQLSESKHEDSKNKVKEKIADITVKIFNAAEKGRFFITYPSYFIVKYPEIIEHFRNEGYLVEDGDNEFTIKW